MKGKVFVLSLYSNCIVPELMTPNSPYLRANMDCLVFSIRMKIGHFIGYSSSVLSPFSSVEEAFFLIL